MGAALELLSLHEFLARPDREDDQREELVDGELIVSPGAKVSHAALVRRLRANLALLEQRGYVLANDFACILGGRPNEPSRRQGREESSIKEIRFPIYLQQDG